MAAANAFQKRVRSYHLAVESIVAAGRSMTGWANANPQGYLMLCATPFVSEMAFCHKPHPIGRDPSNGFYSPEPEAVEQFKRSAYFHQPFAPLFDRMRRGVPESAQHALQDRKWTATTALDACRDAHRLVLIKLTVFERLVKVWCDAQSTPRPHPEPWAGEPQPPTRLDAVGDCFAQLLQSVHDRVVHVYQNTLFANLDPCIGHHNPAATIVLRLMRRAVDVHWAACAASGQVGVSADGFTRTERLGAFELRAQRERASVKTMPTAGKTASVTFPERGKDTIVLHEVAWPDTSKDEETVQDKWKAHVTGTFPFERKSDSWKLGELAPVHNLRPLWIWRWIAPGEMHRRFPLRMPATFGDADMRELPSEDDAPTGMTPVEKTNFKKFGGHWLMRTQPIGGGTRWYQRGLPVYFRADAPPPHEAIESDPPGLFMKPLPEQERK